MAKFTIRSNAREVALRMQRMKDIADEAQSPEFKRAIAQEIADEGLDILKITTRSNIRPGRWFLSGAYSGGATVDEAWETSKVDEQAVEWENANPIFGYLNRGTKAHGPKNAKALFIPLTREAAVAYLEGKLDLDELERGEDYVFAKWVNGIEPRNIIGQAVERIRVMVKLVVNREMSRLMLKMKQALG